MRYRRRKLFRFRLKKDTVYTIFAILLIGSGSLVALSFFQNGTYLDVVRTNAVDKFGWGAYLLPLVLISLSSLFLKLRLSFARPNVSLGFLLSFICLLSITRAGLVGTQIWDNFSALVSGIGAFIILFGMLCIGLMVLFNTSIDEIVKAATLLLKELNKLLNFLPRFNINQKISKPIFVEKLPMRPPTEYKKDERQLADTKQKAMKDVLPFGTSLTNLPSGLITNLPSETTVWEYPPFSLLSSSLGQKADRGDMKQNAHIIEKTLESFGISARVVEVNLGPAVTQYALEIAMGTKLSKITALSNDLALALAAPTGQIRIEAPIPGRSMVGIEIPNRSLEFVTLKQMLSSENMKIGNHKLLVALGLDVSGTPITANISKMPHVLIAGTTGSGKSVLINTWISSLLYRTSPQEVRLILVDPKRVELTGFNGIPHLLTPVIVEPDKILSALKWALAEMDRRYKTFAEVGVRNVDGYNELAGFQSLPYIVIFIDELADLMAYSPVEVEDSICRLAQMARATGIHLVISTQRPSVDVITGLIKANIPSRIAFNVSSMIDSRVIIDMPGAEKLLGRGDMLYIPPDQAKPTRIQGTYISDQEVQKLVEFLKSKNIPVQYTTEVTSMPHTWKKPSGGIQQMTTDGKDPLFEEALRVVCQYDRASASLLQRRLSIGYARAARILDQLEEEGIVGVGEGSKPRDVLIHNAEEYLASRAATDNPVISNN
ncbi:DNA translocase FtsK [Candidatus Gottesmanbacteria bacterium]|nr:DNA translocase FtsK [Candidatus Gottesmanbacteria bacterium]MBI5452175.1 DNA translocase FtsK [Candidatus Gottesmanbacteria bacterium]